MPGSHGLVLPRVAEEEVGGIDVASECAEANGQSSSTSGTEAPNQTVFWAPETLSRPIDTLGQWCWTRAGTYPCVTIVQDRPGRW